MDANHTDTVVALPKSTVQMNTDHALLLDVMGQRLITFHRAFVDVTGGVTSALWLSWAVEQVRIHAARPQPGQVSAEDASQVWFESNHQDCERATGLTRREQDTARRVLREARILEERSAHRGKGFKIDLVWLHKLLAQRSAEGWAGYARLVTPPGSASASLQEHGDEGTSASLPAQVPGLKSSQG